MMGVAAQMEHGVRIVPTAVTKDVKYVYQVSATGSRYPEKLFGLTKSPDDEPAESEVG